MTLTTVNSSGVKDDSIVNADIKSDAAIAGTKIDPDFGGQQIDTTGNIVCSAGQIQSFGAQNGLWIKRTVAGTSSGYSLFGNNTRTWALQYNSEQFSINDYTAVNVPRLAIDENGKVGIGTITQTGQLTIKNADDANINVLEVQNDNGNVSGGFSQSSDGDGTFFLKTDDPNDIKIFFRSNGDSYFNSGKVGIGLTTGIQSKLHVQDVEGTTLTLGNTAAAASDGDYLSGIDFWIKDNNDSTGAATASIRTYADQNHTASAKGTALAFHTTDDDTTTLDERMRITHNGDVGIGTINPAIRLDVVNPNANAWSLSSLGVQARFQNSSNTNGSAAGLQLRTQNSGGAAALQYIHAVGLTTNYKSDLVFSTRTGDATYAETVRIKNGGQLHVYGEGAADTGSIEIQAPDPFIRLYDTNGATDKKKWDIRAVGGANYEQLEFRTLADNNTGFATKVKMWHTSGDLEIIDGNLKVASTHGIDFSAQTASSATGVTVGSSGEILDHYEEGSWSPKVRGHTTAGTYSASNTVGRYTRIGDVVTLTIYVSYTLTGAGGYWEIYDLPFASRVGNYACGAVFIKRMNISDTVKNNVLYVGSGASLLSMYGTPDDAVWIRQEVDNTSGTNEQGIIGSITYKTDT